MLVHLILFKDFIVFINLYCGAFTKSDEEPENFTAIPGYIFTSNSEGYFTSS
jgi:hypothetical protein